MKMMNKHVENTYYQIDNTLQMLFKQGFLREYRKVEYRSNGNKEILAWSNHIPGRQNSGDYFTRIGQYIYIYENGAFHGIINDGSIIRVSFTFQKNILMYQSLLYWPAPIIIPEQDIEELGIREAMQIYLNSLNCDTKELRMRSPFRYDYDCDYNSEDHPSTHIHMQHYKSRIRTNKPICFNTFIKFIIKYFYPTIPLDLRNYESMHYSFYSLDKGRTAIINI